MTAAGEESRKSPEPHAGTSFGETAAGKAVAGNPVLDQRGRFCSRGPRNRPHGLKLNVIIKSRRFLRTKIISVCEMINRGTLRTSFFATLEISEETKDDGDQLPFLIYTLVHLLDF